jgi:hypothetical protein
MLLMTMAIRLLTGLILLAGGLAGASSLHPDLQAILGWQAIPAAEKNPVIEKGQITVARLNAKEKVIVALVVGDLNLFEAAAWFHELNLTPKESPEHRWRQLPGRCDGEKLCRQVIGWMRVRLEDTMPVSQAQAKVQEMEAALEAHIARHGKVMLPSR